MGSILAKNLIEEKTALPSQIKVIKQSKKNCIPTLEYFKNSSELPQNYQADLVFLAIKPQDSEKILREFSKSRIFHPKTIFISILAGKKIEFFEKIFGEKSKIVRSMPNLPIQDSQGIFTYFYNHNINKTESKKLEKIFLKFGSILKLTNENLFDATTAIFASGPAYIFLLEEIFTEIALTYKVSKREAADLTRQLFFGTSLMSHNSNLNFTELRESVTSKNGITAAALEVLQKDSALKNLFRTAIDCAVKRSQELSK